MSLPSDDAAIAAWVSARLAEFDDSPRDKAWRRKALGMPRPVALAMAPREYRLDLRIPVGEMRLVNDVAKAHGLGTRTYLRRVLATMMVVVDDVDPEMLPYLAHGGLIGPPR